MDSKKKRQHYNPELVLKNFVGINPLGQVWTYDKETGDRRPSIPRETGFGTRFYSTKNEAGVWDDSVEDALSKLESIVAPIYTRLLKNELPANSALKEEFSYFLALSYFRTPGMRRIYGQIIGESIQTQMYARAIHSPSFERGIRDYETDSGKEIDSNLKQRIRQDMLDPSGYVLKVPKDYTVSVLKFADKIAYLFSQMSWTILTVQHGFLVTSDHPLTKSCDPKSLHPFYGDRGFENKTVEVSFPISKEKALLLTWRKDISILGLAPRKLVDMMNNQRVAFAERFIYSHIDHAEVAKLVKRHKDLCHGIRTSGFGPEKYAKVEVAR